LEQTGSGETVFRVVFGASVANSEFRVVFGASVGDSILVHLAREYMVNAVVDHPPSVHLAL
jgi:hypothetical protein